MDRRDRETHSPRTVHSFLRLSRRGVPFKGFPLRVSIIRPIPNCAMPELLPVQGSRTLNSAKTKKLFARVLRSPSLSLPLAYTHALTYTRYV